MSMEMKNTLEQWFAGIFAPAELSAVDYYSLFAGVLKKRFVWILVGILICQTSLSGIICYASAVCVSFQAAVIVCALTMHSGVSGILLFLRAGLSTGDLLCAGGVSRVDRGPGTGAGE